MCVKAGKQQSGKACKHDLAVLLHATDMAIARFYRIFKVLWSAGESFQTLVSSTRIW